MVKSLLACASCAILFVLGTMMGCSKTNNALCCVSTADCAAVGIPDGSKCGAGAACLDHICSDAVCANDSECPATAPHCGDGVCRECTEAGQCGLGEPVCNANTFECDNCNGPQDCAAYPGQNQCAASGACVECISASQCTDPASPVCSRNGDCRGCEHDVECASAACDADGKCVDPANVIYISNSGVDAGSCVQTQPCKTVVFANGKVAGTRTHVSFAVGIYFEKLDGVVANVPRLPAVQYHGNGATLRLDSSSLELISAAGNKVLAREFMIELAPGAQSLWGCSNGTIDLRHLVGVGNSGYASRCNVSISDSKLSNATFTANKGTAFALTNVEFSGGRILDAVEAGIQINNVSIFRPQTVAIKTVRSTGLIQNVTIVDPLDPSGGFDCSVSPFPTVTSTIFWAPKAPARAALVGYCVVTGKNIFGPTAAGDVPDPMFKDLANGDLHLLPGSPAIDQADSGPATDIEGNPRPRGARFDIGAYEAQ
jgi:hypothetical protein